jgi:succinate dehydrogenase / fumarate reductase cytochrome b subunit
MTNFFNSSIGKKVIMSVSGLFLVLFLMVHLLVNSFLLIPDGGRMFNAGAHFMATNPVIKIIEPVLAAGFVIHIIFGAILTLQNRKAKGKIKYASGNKTKNILWASKNMFILGLMILSFLILHLSHFWLKMKFTSDKLLEHITIDIAGVATRVENSYALINYTFSHLWIVIVYIIAIICLGLHLSHGISSGFQTVGLNNKIWQKRLKFISIAFAIIISTGFSLIVLGQYCFYQ